MADVIFYLHKVYPDGRRDDLSLKDFVRALKLIKSRFKVVPLGALFEERDTKPRAAITFDDGYADNFVYAYPVLKRLGIPAHLFITADRIASGDVRKSLSDYWEGRVSFGELHKPLSMFESHTAYLKGDRGDYLTWEELSLMGDVFTFGSHGLRHLREPVSPEIVDFYDGSNFHWEYLLFGEPEVGTPRFKTRSSLSSPLFKVNREVVDFCLSFPKGGNWKEELRRELYRQFKSLGNPETEEEEKKRIEEELLESKRLIEERLGVEVTTFSWPFGHFSELSEKVASSFFRYVFTTKRGVIGEDSLPYRLPRVPLGKDIFTVVGRVLTFSTPLFSLYKLFKKEKTL